MIVVGFEDRDAGQRRIVARDLVGGLALKDSSGHGGAPATAAVLSGPPDCSSPSPRAPPPPDPAAAGATSSPVDSAALHAWRWRDTDGTIRKARMRTGLIRSNSAASTSSAVLKDGGGGGGNGNGNGNGNGSSSSNSNNNNSNSSSSTTNGAAPNTTTTSASAPPATDTSSTSTTNTNPDTTTPSAPGTPTPTALTITKTKKFPPDGGVGLRAVALWSYWPADGVHDELLFPKGAEIREAEDINGDWFWGCYAGGKGLFPGGYVTVL